MPQTEQVTKHNAGVAIEDAIVSAEELKAFGIDQSDLEYLSDAQIEKQQKAVAKKNDKAKVVPVQSQSFTITLAESLEEFGSLFPKRALEFANYGAKLAQQNVMRDTMRSDDFEPVDGAIDLAPLVQEPKPERTIGAPKDPVKAAEKSLAALAKSLGKDTDSPEFKAMVASILGTFGVPAGESGNGGAPEPVAA